MSIEIDNSVNLTSSRYLNIASKNVLTHKIIIKEYDRNTIFISQYIANVSCEFRR
jgi:hypothetical protein